MIASCSEISLENNKCMISYEIIDVQLQAIRVIDFVPPLVTYLDWDGH